MGDLAPDKEFKLEFLVISTDSCQTHRAWIDRREEGAPVAMLGDMTGHGGVVQAVNVTGKGGEGVGSCELLVVEMYGVCETFAVGEF